MSELVKLRTINEHSNVYGDAFVKAVGDEYLGPADLADVGICELVSGDDDDGGKDGVPRGQGTGKGDVGDRKGGDA